jgi:hypothetical protein
VVQWLFGLLSGWSDTVWLFKGVFLAADVGVCVLLVRRFGRVAALVYAWNPLVIYNIAGGGHFDALFILAITAAWLVFPQSREDAHGAPAAARYRWSALLLGVSIGIKWVSAPLVAFLCLRAMRDRRFSLGMECAILAVLPTLLGLWAAGLWMPFQDLVPKDFALYARSAEFIPRLVASVWEESSRMNWIFILPLGLATLALVWRCRSWTAMAEGFFFSLFILSPAVHAWYFLWIIPFAAATRNWGTRLVSITAFTYFILQERTATYVEEAPNPWVLTPLETAFLWGPFVAGFTWTWWRRCR